MLLPTAHANSKYRLEIATFKRRLSIIQRLSLFVTIFSVAIFLIHVWRQCHSSKGSRLISFEHEIHTLKKTIEKLEREGGGGGGGQRKAIVPYDVRLGAVRPPKELIDPEEELFDRMIVFDNFVPPSVVSCTGQNATERVCRIKNLCFDPTRNLFFILKNGATIIQNGKQLNDSRLVDGTSIDGHNRFFIDYVESDPSIILNRPVHWVDRVTYIIARFHRMNIMHTLHDDFMGLFHLAKLHGPANQEDPTAPFSLDTNIFFSDWYGKEYYDYLFRMISQNPLQYRSEWRKSTNHPICFAQAIVGNSKHSTWYNYGFMEPQAPIPNKVVSGLHVRDGARYIMRRLGIASWYEDVVKDLHKRMIKDIALRQSSNVKQYNQELLEEDGHFVTIFVRQRDRLILNLAELELTLTQTYGLPVRQVRMEDQTLTQQIMILRSTMVAIGLHGSALIFGIFLPPGAVLVELFPFAVPPQNYTPYKTMTQLPGMRITYKAWKNVHLQNNQPHPDRQPEQGGLLHLSEQDRLSIQNSTTVPPHLCCRDPIWLYRIYQDTIVEIEELISVIDEGLIESSQQFQHTDKHFYTLTPASPDHVECEIRPRFALGSKEAVEAIENPLDMTVRWSKPWNGVSTTKFGIWVHQHFSEFFSLNNTMITFEECSPGTTYDFWVRGYNAQNIPGLYSEQYRCSCAIGASAIKVEKSVMK